MSHVFEITDGEYRALEEAARERGQSPEEFFHSWVEAVRRQVEHEQIALDQAWFWTPEWQAKEREADVAIAAGEGTLYESPGEFLAALDEE